VDVFFITESELKAYPVEDLPKLMDRRDEGVIWVDVQDCDVPASEVLMDVFGFHGMAIKDFMGRTRVPKVHAYADHFEVVLHSPELGKSGHVHYIELDQVVGPGYLVTVHGPMNQAVDKAVAFRETKVVLNRLGTGRLHVTSSLDLCYAIVSTLSRTMESTIEELTAEVWRLEKQVTAGHLGNPEAFLEELFRARHGLIAVLTMARLSKEIFGRLSGLSRVIPADKLPLMRDIVDQFERVQSLATGQKEYHQGVIDFYQARTDTKMTIAAERLAVIAVITLPVTALASIYGMNVIVNSQTHYPQLVLVLLGMAVMSAWLLRWAKRQGWW
jgi:Mg2+ and Co2+ transporter CorA